MRGRGGAESLGRLQGIPPPHPANRKAGLSLSFTVPDDFFSGARAKMNVIKINGVCSIGVMLPSLFSYLLFLSVFVFSFFSSSNIPCSSS